jgi:hypothetical protein
MGHAQPHPAVGLPPDQAIGHSRCPCRAVTDQAVPSYGVGLVVIRRISPSRLSTRKPKRLKNLRRLEPWQ